ncbi:MAG: hypothetical protein J6Z14_05710 [Prevotella sp.]|nr:hypothetical protein [Prevotella sp.]
MPTTRFPSSPIVPVKKCVTETYVDAATTRIVSLAAEAKKDYKFIAIDEGSEDGEVKPVVACFLKRKILRFTQGRSQREIDEVDLNEIRPHLCRGFELPEEFPKCCAYFHRFVTREGSMLRIDHDKYGNYLFMYFYDLTADERQALIELDMMLELIREEMTAPKEVALPDVLATTRA